jgi:hypothetical protein
LAIDEGDIADPIGGPVECYERCAAELKAALTERLANIEL